MNNIDSMQTLGVLLIALSVLPVAFKALKEYYTAQGENIALRRQARLLKDINDNLNR